MAPHERPACYMTSVAFGSKQRTRQLGYSSPADIIDKYPSFFWNSVSMHLEDGIKYLKLTVSGRQWIANLHHHVLCAEHANRLMGPRREPRILKTTTVAPDVGLVLALLTTPSGYRHSSATDECPPPAPLF